MSEALPQFTEQLSFLIALVATMATIFVLALIFINTRPIVELKTLERTSIELAENLFSSPLTTSRAVFDSSEISKFHNTIDEPFVRHCRYAYKLKLQTQGKSWNFGYSPSQLLVDEQQFVFVELPASVDGLPAKLQLGVYDRLTTRLSCIAEKAYRIKGVHETYATCGLKPPDCIISFRRKDNDPKSNYVCMFYKDSFTEEDVDCRYLPDVPIATQYISIKGAANPVKFLAIPVKKGLTISNCGELFTNNVLNKNFVASENEEVGIVFICAAPSNGRSTPPSQQPPSQPEKWACQQFYPQNKCLTDAVGKIIEYDDQGACQGAGCLGPDRGCVKTSMCP